MISKCLRLTYLALYRSSLSLSYFKARTYISVIKLAPSGSSILSTARKVPLLTRSLFSAYLASIILGNFLLDYLVWWFQINNIAVVPPIEWVIYSCHKVSKGNHMRLRLDSRSCSHASSTSCLLMCYSSGYVILAGCTLVRFIRTFFDHAICLV